MEELTNREASRRCMEMGATLFVPRSQAQENTVLALLRATLELSMPVLPGLYHIGLYQNQKENMLYTSSGDVP